VSLERSPYAPPRAPLPDSGTVDVKRSEPLSLVCLKCASSHGVAAHPKTLVVIGRMRVLQLGIALVAGVTIALLRSGEIRMYVFFGLAVVALLMRRFLYPRIDLGIPLCPTCADRWASGVRWSKIFRGMILGFGALMTALTAMNASSGLVLLFGVGIFAGVIAQLLLRLRTRLVVAKDVKGDVVTLALVHADAVTAITGSGRA
jgi:hypothetical protein